MTRLVGLRAAFVLFLAVFLALEARAAVSANPAGPVLAHWSQIVGNSSETTDVLPVKLMARFILDSGAGPGCRDFTLEPRSASSTPTAPTAVSERAGAASAAFPIIVCQFEMFADWKNAALFQTGSTNQLASFPGPYGIGRSNGGGLLAIGVGDTGCRASDCTANSPEQNVLFHDVVQKILAEAPHPDFVLHVGDYRYFNENTAPDSWKKWFIEFFRPAQPLLSVAPVALSRGNHEECDGDEGYWYGERWYQFFEATTSSSVTACPTDSATLHPSWPFDVAVKTSATKAEFPHRTVMVDNSPDPKNFGCRHYSPSSPSCTTFQGVVDSMAENFADATESARAFTARHSASSPSSWWATHKPLWSYPNHYAAQGTEEAVFKALGNTVQGPVSKTLCDRGVCIPSALMAGHAHMYQRSVFTGSTWPVQYVLGHGGVQTLSGTDTVTSYAYHPPVDYTGSFAATVDLIYSDNGFLVLRRNAGTLKTPSGWSVENCLLDTGCHTVSK